MFVNDYLNFLHPPFSPKQLLGSFHPESKRLKHFTWILHFYDCSAIQFYNSRRAITVSRGERKQKGNAMTMAENIRQNDKAGVLNTFSAYIWIIIPLWFLVSAFSHRAMFTFRVEDFFVFLWKISSCFFVYPIKRSTGWWTSSTDIVCISQIEEHV